ncbi:uncharacterized protein RMCC_6432 [Mycolicibacterium canariasense]|uniref:RDD domain-containing protein n=1 Tax=Mycolicibacterium canariasense TaxID=228230 RepID=A0A117ICH2_MYCCR|nr:RDD family protein [Mycolicibacterium canariasense]ORV06499.1 hypothetical protein AWB94_16205 [Mycolicibacterium canariasense]GAS99467.1 uncharacterized protein RMCC_6432 [Mycolicibacterium canariasense]
MTEQPLPQSAVTANPAYTPWLTRVLAFLIDYIPYGIILGIGYAVQATGNATIGAAVLMLSTVIGLAYLLWNYGYKQGTTGSSIGKSVMKFKVVSEATGQPIGFGMSVVRQLAHILDGIICYLGFLLPLIDAKRQTIADKVIKTVCVPVS